jgi:hypothetical protein
METLDRVRDADATVIRAPTHPAGPLMAATNVVVRFLLRSPLHALFSGRLLLLTYTGRTSGERYTIPVSYTRAGDVVTVLTYRSRTWWKQLCGGAPVVVELKRRRLVGMA